MGSVWPLVASAVEGVEAKTTIGRTEKVWIKEANAILEAKIDTGTLTSSLNARDVEVFTKKDKVWVRFVVDSPDGKPITIERSVVRFARFKKQNHDVDRRPVIELGLCISHVYRITEVNLTDRQRFTYPVLIGRRFLSGNVVVDTDKKDTSTPQCREMSKNN